MSAHPEGILRPENSSPRKPSIATIPLSNQVFNCGNHSVAKDGFSARFKVWPLRGALWFGLVGNDSPKNPATLAKLDSLASLEPRF
jgi:hypothetical protein